LLPLRDQDVPSDRFDGAVTRGPVAMPGVEEDDDERSREDNDGDGSGDQAAVTCARQLV